MSEGDRLDRARQRADIARGRLHETLGTLKARLDPHVVARNAADAVVEKGTELVEKGAESAKRNPLRVVAAAGVVALTLGRHRLASLFRRKIAKPESMPDVRPSKTRRRPAGRIKR